MKVIAYLDGKAALVKRDGKGTPITEFEFTHVERISFSPFYAVCKEDKSHFALLYQGKVITPYELETYDAAVDGGSTTTPNRSILYRRKWSAEWPIQYAAVAAVGTAGSD